MSYVENNKYRFPGKKKMEYIPSKLFPLSSKTKVHWFGHPNTSRFELTEKQEEIINSLEFNKGRCYTNTEKLINALERELELKFFSGWVFLGYNLPVHHAWAVLFENGKEYVFDMGVFEREQEIIEEASEKFDDPEKQREYYVKENKRTFELPNSEIYITGKIVPEMILYIGVESTKEEALDCYWEAVGDDPTTHPSYSGMGLDEKGSSRTQRELGLD